MTFNVRSINDKSRQIDLQRTLSANNIDVGFIQECHLRRSRKVRIDGYDIVNDNSPIGVAVLIKKSILHTKIVISDVGVKTCMIQIECLQNSVRKKIALGSLYVPCNYPAQQLEADLDKLMQVCARYDGLIFGGILIQETQTG